jgi:hypothetical protein
MENESRGTQMRVVSEWLAGAMTRPGHDAADLSYDEAAHRINALTD